MMEHESRNLDSLSVIVLWDLSSSLALGREDFPSRLQYKRRLKELSTDSDSASFKDAEFSNPK